MRRGGRQIDRRWRAVVLAALACAVALAATGCTARQSKEQYDEHLKRASATRAEAIQLVGDDEVVEDATFETTERKIDAAIKDLDADPPPKEAQQAHEQMLAGLEGLGRLVHLRRRCAELARVAAQDGKACRQGISQDVYDTIRNDFSEANTIYREKGFSLPGSGGDELGSSGGGSGGDDPEGGDEL